MALQQLSKTGVSLMVISALAIALLGAKTIDFSRSTKTVQSYHKENGWKLIWSDEFSGKDLDRSKWTPEISCWGGGNNERQCYTDRLDNISVSYGVLKLTAKAEQFTGQKYPQGRADRGGNLTQNYTSGKLRTKGLSNWKYGRFEARMKLPQGQSTWPAFWMLPEDNIYGEWPLSGEIDIMETINLGTKCQDCGDKDIETRSSVALHYGKPWPENQFKSKKKILPNGNDAYHVFAVEWSNTKIDWFVDNEKVYGVTHADWFTTGVDKKVNPLAPFDQPFYLMLNLAVGGNLPDSNNEKLFNPKSFPAELLVDWVRVYQCAEDTEKAAKCMGFN